MIFWVSEKTSLISVFWNGGSLPRVWCFCCCWYSRTPRFLDGDAPPRERTAPRGVKGDEDDEGESARLRL